MKTKPTFSFIISLDLFPYDCYVVINKSPGLVQKQLTKWGKPLSEDILNVLKEKADNSAIYVYNTEKRTSLIYINAVDMKKATELFTHENFHFIYRISKTVGINLTDDSEEVFSYGLEYCMKQFLQHTKYKG